MMPRCRTALRAFLLALAGAAIANPSAAQALPDARSLLDRYVHETGGMAMRELQSIRTAGTFNLPAMGAAGDLEMIQARPNLITMKVTIPGLGEIRSGFDGSTGWTLNPMEGPRLLSGGELTQIRDDAAFDSSLRDASLVASMETVEKTQAAGRDCYKVKMTWKSGRETFDCFDAENGLLVATWLTAETAMGAVESTVLYGEYKQFGAVRLPTRTTQQVMGQEFVIIVTNVDFTAVDKAAFTPPAEIQALIRK